jgi:hypothetical protein
MAESTNREALLVGECKWTANENTGRLIHELGQKLSKLPFAKHKTIIYCLFLKKRPKDKQEHWIFTPEDLLKMFG